MRAAAVVVLVLAVTACSGKAPETTADTPATATAERPATTRATTTTTTAPAYEPVPGDFTVDLVILEKACFGSAGCNVTYDVELTYVGVHEIDPTTTYQVTYEVTGGEDGPQINTLAVTGDQYTRDASEFIGIASSETVLTATVTSVR